MELDSLQKLEDAVPYLQLLKTSDDMADIFNGLIDKALPVDKIGKLAQRCYHIVNLRNQLYHQILHEVFDQPLSSS